MTIKPLKNRVVVKLTKLEEKNKTGIILTESKEKPIFADVVSTGSEVTGVKAGDKVVVTRYSGSDTKIDGVEYTIVEEKDIIAVLES